MAAITDHANAAAAVAAGWAKTQIDRGVANAGPDRFITRFEKHLIGELGTYGASYCVEGASPTSAAAADTAAMTALNGVRRARYAGSDGRASGSGDSVGPRGGTMTADVN